MTDRETPRTDAREQEQIKHLSPGDAEAYERVWKDALCECRQLERELSAACADRDTYRKAWNDADAKLSAAQARVNEGWDAFYKLRKLIAEEKYPSLTGQIKELENAAPQVEGTQGQTGIAPSVGPLSSGRPPAGAAPHNAAGRDYCESCGYTDSHDPNCPRPKEPAAPDAMPEEPYEIHYCLASDGRTEGYIIARYSRKLRAFALARNEEAKRLKDEVQEERSDNCKLLVRAEQAEIREANLAAAIATAGGRARRQAERDLAETKRQLDAALRALQRLSEWSHGTNVKLQPIRASELIEEIDVIIQQARERKEKP